MTLYMPTDSLLRSSVYRVGQLPQLYPWRPPTLSGNQLWIPGPWSPFIDGPLDRLCSAYAPLIDSRILGALSYVDRIFEVEPFDAGLPVQSARLTRELKWDDSTRDAVTTAIVFAAINRVDKVEKRLRPIVDDLRDGKHPTRELINDLKSSLRSARSCNYFLADAISAFNLRGPRSAARAVSATAHMFLGAKKVDFLKEQYAMFLDYSMSLRLWKLDVNADFLPGLPHRGGALSTKCG